MFIWVCVVVTILVWAYVFLVREVLDEVLGPRYHRWHLIEDKLWARSRSILVARLFWIGGIVIAVRELLIQQGFDWTPITQEFTDRIPEAYRPIALALMSVLIGLGMEYLRRSTTTPVGVKPETPIRRS